MHLVEPFAIIGKYAATNLIAPAEARLQEPVRVGQRLPAELTSLGRVLLAHRRGADDEESRRIRADGYVVTDGLLETGLRSLAVPLRDHTGDVIASLSIAVNAGRVSIEALEQSLPRLRDAADSIGALV